MPAIKSITIKCGHCGTIFPSPIFVGTTEALDGSFLLNNRVRCPNAACRQLIHCDKNNMSVLYADGSGGEVYWDWGDNKA